MVFIEYSKHTYEITQYQLRVPGKNLPQNSYPFKLRTFIQTNAESTSKPFLLG